LLRIKRIDIIDIDTIGLHYSLHIQCIFNEDID
jgi:hypothetical protein